MEVEAVSKSGGPSKPRPADRLKDVDTKSLDTKTKQSSIFKFFGKPKKKWKTDDSLSVTHHLWVMTL